MVTVAIAAMVFSIPSVLTNLWEAVQDTSRYAPGFSERRFQSIKIGMLEDEVIRRLGKPLAVRLGRSNFIDDQRFGSTRKPPAKYLFFSKSSCDGSYYIRGVGINSSGYVDEIHSEFYQD